MGSTFTREALHRVLADHARDFISLHDEEGRYLYASPACEALLGFTPDEMTGTLAYTYFHPDDIPAIEKHHKENFDVPDHPPVVYRIRCKDGDYIWFETSSRAIEDDKLGDVIVAVSRDVSDRVRAEQEATRSAAAVTALAANIPNGAAYVFDHDLRFLSADGREIRAAGFTPEQIVGKTLGDLLPPETVEVLEPAYRAALTGEDSTTPFLFGEQHYVLYTGPVRDETGRIIGGIALTQNVTPLRLAERQLEESEVRFRGAFETAAHGMAIVNPDGGIEQVNPSLCAMMGYTADEFTQLTFETITHPGDLKKDVRLFERVIAREINHYTLEKRYLHKDGHTLWGLLSVSVVRKADGSPRHVIGQVIDITDRKRTERQLARAKEEWEQTFHAVPDLIALVDPRERVLRINQAFADKLGVRTEDVVNRSARELIAGDAELLETWAGIVSGSVTDPIELELPSFEGWFSMSGTPLVNVEGDPIGTVVVGHDVTERKRIETTLLERSRLEATAVLAGGFAHEMNNLMSVVQGNAELLATRHSDPADQTLLTSIRKSAMMVSDMASDMTAFARKGKYNPRPHRLNELVAATVSASAHNFPPSIHFITRFSADDDGIIGDSNQLKQAVLNLLHNATEALSTRGEHDIFVTTSYINALPQHLLDEDEEQSPFLLLTIRDEGEGMDTETLRHAREPFFTTREFGRGMGLAAVYGIVEAHDGHLELDSLPGFGTTVRLYLPYHPYPDEADAKQSGRTFDSVSSSPSHGRGEASSGSAATGSPPAILVVDDEEGIREMLSTLLGSMDYAVLTAANGKEAIDRFEERQDEIQLVLLDLLMPVMDGTETFHELRARRTDLPIILISGYERDEAIKALLDKGAFAFLHKPFELDELVSQVRASLTN